MSTTIDQPPRAACASHVDDWLWTEHKPCEESIALAEAKPICGGCEVRERCLEVALPDLSLVGIWASTTLEQRRRLARKNARKSRAKEATA